MTRTPEPSWAVHALFARAAKTEARFIYRQLEVDAVSSIWQALQPAEVALAHEWENTVGAIPATPVIVRPDSGFASA